MKFVSFTYQSQSSYGVLDTSEDLIADLGVALGEAAPDLKGLLRHSDWRLRAEAAVPHAPRVRLSDVQQLPVIPNPGKIVCVGLNYHEHVRETQREVTEMPTLFLRVAASQVAHGQDLVIPTESDQLDYEGEIAIVIGRSGRRIAEADAWDHIAGYSCYNDASVRDWQAHSTQWTAGKNFVGTGGFGPWMVSADEIAPNRVMTLVTRVNGAEVQRATTDALIHSIPRQVAYASTVMGLEPGDVIVTGTPGGVGFKRKPQLFLQPGDTVEVACDAIGVLINSVREE